MSAKAAYRKNKSDLPELPQELWIIILKMATEISPWLLDVEPRMFSCPGDFPIKFKTKYRTSLKTKRHIVLVCKLWNALGIPLLYENIYLHTTRATSHLCRTLTGSVRNFEDSNPNHLGYFVKRLDVALRVIDAGIPWPESTETLQTVLQHLPNLSILTFDDNESSINDVLVKTLDELNPVLHCPSLQALNCRDCDHTSFFLEPPPTLDSFPEVRTFDWIFGDSHLVEYTIPVVCISHPTIHYTSHNRSTILSSPETPLSCWEITQIRTNTWHDDMFRTVLSVRSIILDDYLTASVSSYQSVLDELDNYPNLRYLSLMGPISGMETHGLSLPHTVRVLGLSFKELCAPNRKYRLLCDALSSLHADGLQTIRIHERNIPDLRDKHERYYRIMCETIAARGWKLEVGDAHINLAE